MAKLTDLLRDAQPAFRPRATYSSDSDTLYVYATCAESRHERIDDHLELLRAVDEPRDITGFEIHGVTMLIERAGCSRPRSADPTA